MCGCDQLRPANLMSSTWQSAQAAIDALEPGIRAEAASERASNNQIVDMAHAVAWGTSSIALLIGIVGIANTMAMSVFERTREIGILRALGWKGRHVILLILTEAAGLGLAGGLLGILLGLGRLMDPLHHAGNCERGFNHRIADSSGRVAADCYWIRACRRSVSRLARRAAFAGGGVAL